MMLSWEAEMKRIILPLWMMKLKISMHGSRRISKEWYILSAVCPENGHTPDKGTCPKQSIKIFFS